MKCRHCSEELVHTFVDLGSAPPSNAFLSIDDLIGVEHWYPLRVWVCEHCWLVQTEDLVGAADLFNDEYAYFSSYSESWLEHARRYVESMVAEYDLGPRSHVVEIASNDGYLLQYVRKQDIPCLGIEPTHSTAGAAREKGIETLEVFFGTEIARQIRKSHGAADLAIANNVLAHVPDINDFVGGLAVLLKSTGVATFEFPHLLNLVESNQYDTIYHEHFSYLSLLAVSNVFKSNGLQIFRVEEVTSHGGSLRVFAQRADVSHYDIDGSVAYLIAREVAMGLQSITYFKGAQVRAEKLKNDLLSFLIGAKQRGETVVGYGAAAKGNTLLNFAGVRSDLLSYVVDKNPAKQNMYMPGSRIPIVDKGTLENDPPDYVLILPWNIADEIMQQNSALTDKGVRFVVAVPELKVM